MTTGAGAATGPLAGRAVAFVGKFGHADGQRFRLERWARAAGAAIVEPTAALDVLVIGEGRGGKPPGDVAKVLKRLPGVRQMTTVELARATLPDRDAFVRALTDGSERDHAYWDELSTHTYWADAPLDLSGAGLADANLYGAKLERVTLDRADLRRAWLRYAHLGPLRGANLDAANGPNVHLTDLHGCTLRGANLEEAWMSWGAGRSVVGCDFGGARMARARAARHAFTDCTFVGTDLSGAELEYTAFTGCDFTGADLSAAQAYKAKFPGAKFAGANLARADLRETSLRGADLTGAVLTGAALGGADLTDAVVDGADFAGAVLTGATLANVDVSKARNYAPPAARLPGPKVLEFARAAAGAKKFETTARVDLGPGGHAACELSAGPRGRHAATRHYRDGHEAHNWITAPTFEQGLLNMADRWPGGTLRLDTVTAKGSPTVRGAKLHELAVAAWAEAFGVAPVDLAAQQAEQAAAAVAERDAVLAKVRAGGAGAWSAIDFRARRALNLRGADLSGAGLAGLDLTSHDLRGARLVGTDLSGATLYGTDFGGADLTNARLRSAQLDGCKCEKAVFIGATLPSASLLGAKLQGADFTGADLTNANLDKAQFDEKTKWPDGFTIPDGALWKGKGARPGARAGKAAAVGTLTFDAFLKGLPKKVDPSRTGKAAAMLKAERFELYADVTDDALVGVVKSQSSKELVYSCRLASDGHYCCATQNLKACGGLQGALCKHLLVLVVGLAKAGTLDPAVADHWVNQSRGLKPELDKDALAATFLKYKGAEAGEVDWRPTETVPEDFYAM